jgi:hypothetical protein
MTAEERDRFIQLINDPPPGSKVAAAKEFGIDLTLLVRQFELTPTERLRELDSAQTYLDGLRGSWKEASAMSEFERSLTVLLDHKVELVVIGGAAMYARGSDYLTRDLDVCYNRSLENIKRLVNALALYSPTLRGAPSGLPFCFDVPTVTRGLNFTLNTDLGAIDLLGEVAGLGGYAEVRAASTTIEMFGRTCAVLSLDGLIKAKRAAGRPKDLAALPELEAMREMKGDAKS